MNLRSAVAVLAIPPCLLCALLAACGAAIPLSDDSPLTLPEVGAYQLRIIDPATLELFLITKKDPDPKKLETWNFVRDQGRLSLPSASDFEVQAGGSKIAVTSIGFKRRALYAPL